MSSAHHLHLHKAEYYDVSNAPAHSGTDFYGAFYGARKLKHFVSVQCMDKCLEIDSVGSLAIKLQGECRV